MAFKTITIKNKVYMHLIKEKKSDESFSTLFERLLIKYSPPLKKFYGAWKMTIDEEEKTIRSMKRFRQAFEEDFEKHESSRQ